jgi:hypothetical protein
LKRSNADRSVRDALDAALTGGRMHPIMARWGMRGMEDFTAEALVRWPQTRDGWIGQRARTPERTRRRPWVLPPNTAEPA